VAWHFQHSTISLNSLTEIYLDYCFNNCREILREYKLKEGKTQWEFPHFCLTTFLRSGETLCRYKFQRGEKAYLTDAIAYLEAHGLALWQDYDKDPEYKKELAISYKWIRSLKAQGYIHSPRNYFELGLVFSAMECFMMLEEKKLL
jgi:hypothetical protein